MRHRHGMFMNIFLRNKIGINIIYTLKSNG